MKEKILITGGCGYIGTNVTNILCAQGYNVAIIDNFSNSKRKYIDKLIDLYPNQIDLFCENMLNKEALEKIFEANKISAVIHLAGKKYIPESFKKPDEYILNNVDATRLLLETMTKYNVKKLIFSSSITVYGVPTKIPTPEDSLLSPLSPYAQTKVEGEQMIKSWAKENGKAIILRLSNPVGAERQIGLGDDGNKEYKNLLPYIIDQALSTKKLKINGIDHNTKDGSTVRDYIHVCDVASAFVQALNFHDSNIFNIGSGSPGYSVLEIIHEVEKATSTKLDIEVGPKREGDIPLFLTDNKNAKNLLGLKINHTLSDIVSSQLAFAYDYPQTSLDSDF